MVDLGDGEAGASEEESHTDCKRKPAKTLVGAVGHQMVYPRQGYLLRQHALLNRSDP